MVGHLAQSGNVATRKPSEVDDSSTQNANGPAETAISPSHVFPPSQEVEHMDNSSTAAHAATPDWRALANTYENALGKVRALTRNAEFTLSENTSQSVGETGSFSIPEGAYEEIVAMLSGIDAITERALEAA